MRHLTNVRALAIWIVLFLLTRTTLASPKQNEPMNNRGDHVMGFGHDKTTHHFELTN
jgi:hypothetical protein